MKTFLTLVLCCVMLAPTYAQFNMPGDYQIAGTLAVGIAQADMRLSVNASDQFIARFHSTGSQLIKGVRLGVSNSYADWVCLSSGFGIGAGATSSSLPLNSQSTEHIRLFVNNTTGHVGLGTVDPDMRLSVYGTDQFIARFHSPGTQLISGIRIGRTSSYADLINLQNGFGIGAGNGSSNLPLDSQNKNHVYFFINNTSGNVGIGTTNTNNAKLTVAGTVHSREVNVAVDAGSDFVFYDNYKLRTLEEVQKFIKENQHLPDIEPARVMEENGVDLGKMDMKLLQKVEELTLYMIDLKKEMNHMQEENEKLKAKISRLEKRVAPSH